MKKGELARQPRVPMNRARKTKRLSFLCPLSASFYAPYGARQLPFFLFLLIFSVFVTQGLGCVRNAPHRRLFSYVHRIKSCAKPNAHNVPQTSTRPSLSLGFVILCSSLFLSLLPLSLPVVVDCLSVCLQSTTYLCRFHNNDVSKYSINQFGILTNAIPLLRFTQSLAYYAHHVWR